MKNISAFILLCSYLFLATPAQAGFWSSTLGTVAGNAITRSNSGNTDASQDEKKVQQVMTKLGYYESQIDGNLNTFDSRTAIEMFQSHYQIDDSGILNNTEFQNVIYMHDLLKNYKNELAEPGVVDTRKLKQLYKAFDKLEKNLSKKRLSSEFISDKFRKEISEKRAYIKKTVAQERDRERARIAKLKADRKSEIDRIGFIDNNDGTLTDTKTNLTWAKCIYGQLWSGDSCKGKPSYVNGYSLFDNDGKSKSFTYSGKKDWIIPTADDLNTIVDCGDEKRLKVDSRGFEGQCTRWRVKELTINTLVFPNTKNGRYWTSTTISKDRKRSISFKSGRNWWVKYSFNNFVRLVRYDTEFIINVASDYSKTSTKILNDILWEMHTLKKYSGHWKMMLTELEKRELSIWPLDTLAWVYKDNGNKQRAIEIYETKILTKEKTPILMKYFAEIKE